MDRAAKRNQNLMHLIKRVHGIVENPDIEKHRQSQDTLGSILGIVIAIIIYHFI